MKRVFLLAGIALALLLAFVVQQQVWAATPSALDGTSWVLSSLNGQLPLADSTVTLQFDADGSASGSDGCNRYSIGFSVEGAALTFDAAGGIGGMMACPEAVMTQASDFMAALASTTEFVARGSALILMDDNTVVATFVTAAQNLDDTAWQVIAYNNGNEAVVSVLEGTEVSVAFDANEGLNGNAGCNDYFATYLATDGAILIGRIGSTMRLCPEPNGVMEQEQAYLAALQSATRFVIEGNTLTLRTSSDAIAVQAVRALQVDLPEPTPGVPTARVTAQTLNLRSGPGTNFPVLGVARYGDEAEIIGRSADGRWWVLAMASAPGGSVWASADFIAATDAADVSIIASPAPPVVIPAPTATPWPTPAPWPTPVPTPAPQLSFSANPTTINQGQCSTLRWSVEHVQAVWVYPQGRPYRNYPRVGQGSEQVCPPTTTTYEMRVLLRDGSVTTQRVTVNVTPAAPQNPLNGTAWQVTSFNNGRQAVISPLSGTNLTLRFESNDRLSGNGGCNTFNAGYSVSGSNLWIGQPSSGMMLCSDVEGQMEQEQQFFAALQSVSTFRFDGNRLELRSWDGSMAVNLSRLQ